MAKTTKAAPAVEDKKQRREFLKKAEETLLETKKQLLREIQDRVKTETEGSKDEGRDTYDLASDERDREINFILTDRERDKLLAIDEALQRIKDKSYGICECGCENCEGEIRLGDRKSTRLNSSHQIISYAVRIRQSWLRSLPRREAPRTSDRWDLRSRDQIGRASCRERV